MNRCDLDAVARRQHGVVHRSQTHLSSSAWHRATASGALVAMHRCVACLPGTADTPQQQMMAAVLAAGPSALVSHRSAALLHGVPIVRPDVVDLIVTTSRTHAHTERTASVRGLDGVVIHRPSDRRRLAPQSVDAIPCTDILRTLVDLGAVADDLVNGAVGHTLTTGLASLESIVTTLDEHARRGRTGIGALRRALQDWSIDAQPTDSVLEPMMQRLVANYGLAPVEFRPQVGGRDVAFRIVGTPIVIECDRWTHHGRDRASFEQNCADDADFLMHGWIVLRFTYRRIALRPSTVAHQIRAALAQWSGVESPDAA